MSTRVQGLLLSAAVVTRNERDNIDRCLAALEFCDEIVVVDSGSDDGTVEAARRYTDRVLVEEWRGYAAQKQRAADLCRGAWVLAVDADEVVTPELARAIEAAVRPGGPADARGVAAYTLRRRMRYLGRWIRHGGWGDDRVVRLFRKNRARYSDVRVHERVEADGPTALLQGWLEHHSYRDLDHHWRKILELSRLGAEQALARGRRASAIDLALRPPGRFLRIYVLKLGFLDGWRGLVIAGLAAAYVLLKYARIKEGTHE